MPDGTLEAPGGEWPQCPGQVLAHPDADLLRWVWDASQVGPLSGWPQEHPVRIVVGMRELGARVHERAKSEAKT